MLGANHQNQIADLLIVALADDGAHHPQVLLTCAVVVATPVWPAIAVGSLLDQTHDPPRQLRERLGVHDPVVPVEQIFLVDVINRAVVLEEQSGHILARFALLLFIAARDVGQRVLNAIGEHQKAALRLDLFHAQ